jgi:iron complex outermembrane receptor protein
LSLRQGSFGTTEASAAAGSDALRAAAGYTRTSGYADGLDGRRAFVRAGGRLSGKASILDVQAGYVGARFGAAQFYGPYPADEDVSRFLGSISASTRLGSVLAGRLRLTGEASRDDFRLFREEPDRYRNLHDTHRVSAELELRGTGRSIDYALGMTTTGDEIESDGIRNGLASPALGRHKRTFHSLNASLEKESDGWSWRLGLDAGFGDYRGLGGAVVLGRSLFKTVRLTGAVARTYRVPTYTELYYSDPIHLANPSLAAERMDSASVSVDGAFGRLTLGGRAFFNRTDGLIDWIRPVGETVWQSSNIAAGSFAGIDLRGEWATEHFSTRLLVTRQRRRISAGAGAEMKYHFTFPELSLSLIVSGECGPWSGSAALKAEREEGSVRVRPYLSARIRRTWGRLELFADFQNLFNQRFERIPGLLEAPRSAGLGLAWEF